MDDEQFKILRDLREREYYFKCREKVIKNIYTKFEITVLSGMISALYYGISNGETDDISIYFMSGVTIGITICGIKDIFWKD